MIVTDLDDTLYKERDFVRSGYKEIARQLDLCGLMQGEKALSVLENAETTAIAFDRLAGLLQTVDHESRFTVGWMVETYRFHFPDIVLADSVSETLLKLLHREIRLGIITDGRSATQRAKIRALGLDRFVAPENIIISEEIGQDKTSAIPFELIVSRNPSETEFWYVGDNPAKDFRHPNRLGWTTVQLNDPDGVNVHSQSIDVPDEFHAKFTIDNLSDLLTLIASGR